MNTKLYHIIPQEIKGISDLLVMMVDQEPPPPPTTDDDAATTIQSLVLADITSPAKPHHRRPHTSIKSPHSPLTTTTSSSSSSGSSDASPSRTVTAAVMQPRHTALTVLQLHAAGQYCTQTALAPPSPASSSASSSTGECTLGLHPSLYSISFREYLRE